MMIIELFEPAMCCSSGVCGPSVDPKLVKLQETLRLIEEKGGIEVNRYNLSSDPDAFVKNAAIVEVLKEQGPHALPVIYIDGEVIAEHEYPSIDGWHEALKARGVEIDLNSPSKNDGPLFQVSLSTEEPCCQPSAAEEPCCPPSSESSDCGPGCDC